MELYLYTITIFSLFMTSFKAGHLRGAKKEKYNVGEILQLLPFVFQSIIGIVFIFKNIAQ